MPKFALSLSYLLDLRKEEGSSKRKVNYMNNSHEYFKAP